MIKLKDLFPDYMFKGAIFETMGQMFDLPWKGEFENIEIDIDYLSTFGERGASRLVRDCLEKYNGRVLNDNEKLVVDDLQRYVITNQGIYQIAKILFRRFGVSWSKLYDTMKLQYNPIENYSMVETENVENESAIENSITGTDSVNHTIEESEMNSREKESSNTSEENDTNSKSIEQSGSGSGNSKNGVYAFNSTTSQPTTTGESENSNSTNGAESGSGKIEIEASQDESETVERRLTGKNDSVNTKNINNNSNTSQNQKRELKRSGNIGVTTSQQMIQSERELWLYDYFKIIYQQMNSVLTIPYYEC